MNKTRNGILEMTASQVRIKQHELDIELMALRAAMTSLNIHGQFDDAKVIDQIYRDKVEEARSL